MIDEFFSYFGLTYGVLIIIGVGLIVFLLIAMLLEHRTKILFPERSRPKDDKDLDDDFLSFGNDDEDE